ncbi:MAG: NAD(+) synthase, partial [Oscillospiraceae bacterium]|nr:NAD(+) synthase [Oscillospiraceae bacterium]
ARERTQVLMDLANMENALVVGTGDMSEEALGWCTFNGDHMSMYNVNCSVTKTLIRAVVSHYADNCGDPELRDALYDIVATPVSPELKPSSQGEIAQKTEEILGPYDAHDFFLYHFIRNGSSPKKILFLAETAFDGVYTREQLSGWIKLFFRRFFQNQFKRNCVPDGPAVGSISLSYTDWKMPGDLSADAILRELD